jgi:hypothetical protein
MSAGGTLSKLPSHGTSHLARLLGCHVGPAAFVEFETARPSKGCGCLHTDTHKSCYTTARAPCSCKPTLSCDRSFSHLWYSAEEDAVGLPIPVTRGVDGHTTCLRSAPKDSARTHFSTCDANQRIRIEASILVAVRN